MLMFAFLIGSAFFTSILSAVLGMAGGMVLMGLLPLVLTLPAAFAAHGIIQFFANAYRAWLLRKHIHRGIALKSAYGAIAALAFAVCVRFTPHAMVVAFVLGTLPFVRRLPLPRGMLRVEFPGRAAASGFLVAAVQIFAGVAGPLLDVFYLDTSLDKHAVVATKAVGQAFSHLLKTCYFVCLPYLVGGENRFSSTGELSQILWILPFAVGAAFVGTALGARLLERVSDTWFRAVTTRAIECIGVAFLFKGFVLLMGFDGPGSV